MSKLRLLILLTIVGCIVFLISHMSIVYNRKDVRLINSVHVHNDNHFHNNDHIDKDVEKHFQNEDKNKDEPEKGHLEIRLAEENNDKNKEENKPPVNIKVEKTSDVKDTELDKTEADAKSSAESAQEPDENKTETNKEASNKNEKKEETGIAKTIKESKELPLCSARGEHLVGPLFIDQSKPKDMEEVEKLLSVEYGGTVEKGGWWEPTSCKPRIKVAVIIPYRNRFEQLKIFLRHLHPMLQRQQLYYRIVVVDMLEKDPFNRAGLFNIGYVESLKLGDFTCFVFTDVDLLPEDDRNYYGCPTSPRHMSVGVDKFNYVLPYSTIFGGVGSFSKEHFERINGMSNMFWGWGGEDDDLYARITQAGYKLSRPSIQIGRYTMIKIDHFRSSEADPNRMNLLRNSKERMHMDGLNTLHYELKEVEETPLDLIKEKAEVARFQNKGF